MTSAGSRFLNTVTKDIFLRSISRSRLGEGKSVVYYCFNVSRRRILSLNEDLVHKNGVVYLMSRDCRIDDNWAFLYSQKLALQNELPLFVCVLTKDFSSLYPTKRQLEFAMGGFRWLRGQCECKNVGFYFLNANVEDFIGVVLENDVSGVVIDFSPLRKPVEWRDYLIRNLPKDVPLIEVTHF